MDPDKVLVDGEGTWKIYSEDKVGITTVTYQNSNTATELATFHPNPRKRTASQIAWAGARHSRAPGDTIDILVEMGDKGIDPDKKLEETFKNFGHKSVGDMASVTVQFNNVPMHVPMNIFNDSAINTGQEKSTRYQKKFGNAALHPLKHYLPKEMFALSEQEWNAKLQPLNAEYQALGELSLRNFNEMKNGLTEAYTRYFSPSSDSQRRSLDSRVLDSVRFFLLLGQSTGFAFETGASDWVRILSHLKGSPMKVYSELGKQLETLLAPGKEIEKELGFLAEVPSLLEFTEPHLITKQNLSNLRSALQQNHPGDGNKFNDSFYDSVRINPSFKGYNAQGYEVMLGEKHSAEKMAAQFLLALNPGAEISDVFEWLNRQSDENKKALVHIMKNGYTHQKEMPDQLAGATDITVLFKGTLGELRDYNRHRAWARFMQNIPLYFGEPMQPSTTKQIVNEGFGAPLYLTDIPQFNPLLDEYKKRMNDYYSHLFSFVGHVEESFGESISHDFILNLLPLGHRSNIWMHSNPKQLNYLQSLRTRWGGHINYRALTFDAAQELSKKNPFMDAFEPDGPRPDPSNLEEFFGRS